MSGRVAFTCDGEAVEVDVAPGESLLSVLRERLGIISVKDGCAPQGQCGCCTVLVDGERAGRVRHAGGRGSPAASVTTVDGLAAATSATGSRRRSSRPAARSAGSARPGSSCGPPALRAKGRDRRVASTARSPRTSAGAPAGRRSSTRSAARGGAAARTGRSTPRRGGRALEGGVAAACRARRRRSAAAAFADDTAPRDALVAVPLPPGSDRRRASRPRGCAGSSASRCSRRATRAGKVQGRRTTVDARAAAPVARRSRTAGCGSRRAGSSPRTSNPTRRGASPAASRRRRSRTAARSAARRPRPSRAAARELADRLGRTVRACSRARTSCGSARSVRRSRRARCCATASIDDRGHRRAGDRRGRRLAAVLRRLEVHVGAGRPRSPARRSRATRARPGCAEQRACSSRARSTSAGFDRAAHLVDERTRRCSSTTSCVVPTSARCAGARVTSTTRPGALERVEVRVAAGDPLDEIVLRSYAIGAAHMALGWVLHRGARGRSRDRRGARPHDPLVRRSSAPRTRRRSTSTIVDDDGPPLRAVVRRGVRRGRGGDVERARSRRGRAARDVPRAVDTRDRPYAAGR